jgi:hypothetical protein
MTNEINRDFYCSAGFYNGDGICDIGKMAGRDYGECITNCSAYHRKHPTLEDYELEYGEEYPKNGAAYYRVRSCGAWLAWVVDMYGSTTLTVLRKQYSNIQVVCACTPFGRPPDDWRPE